jgi:hypothetical protein
MQANGTPSLVIDDPVQIGEDVEWHMRQSLAPVLRPTLGPGLAVFDDEQRGDRRPSPVAPATRFPKGARQTAETAHGR